MLGYAVDLWALGVIAFELFTGVPPFNDDTKELVFQHILDRGSLYRHDISVVISVSDIPWPEEGALTDASVDLVDRLLDVDSDSRPHASGSSR